MVTSQVLDQVVTPCKAILPFTGAAGHCAINELLFVGRFEMSHYVRLAAERANRPAARVSAIFV
jgi:hypothetical protein